MTKLEFVAECVKRTMLPEIVLENSEIRESLKSRDDKRVIELLDSEF